MPVKAHNRDLWPNHLRGYRQVLRPTSLLDHRGKLAIIGGSIWICKYGLSFFHVVIVAFDNSDPSWKAHIVCSNCCFTPSSVSMSDLERLEKLTHSKLPEPRLSHGVCHHGNTNKASRLLSWVVTSLSVIYSLKPHLLTHLKSPTRPDRDNLSHLGPKIGDIQRYSGFRCFIKWRLCVNVKHLSGFES